MDLGFQTFDTTTDPGQGAPRVAALRAELERRGLDGMVVPHADEFQNEFLPPHTDRLAWLTGFTGSAGSAVVLKDKAAIFVDGRYVIQVRDQVDPNLFAIHNVIDKSPAAWIEEEVEKGRRIGFDPKLHAVDAAARLRKACDTAGATLVAVADNPVDAVWHDRPAPPVTPVVVHDERYAGRPSADKRAELSEALQHADVNAVVLTAPASIAWLLNIRGRDVARTPLALAQAIAHDDGRVDLYIDARKVTPEVRAHLGNAVTVHDADRFGDALAALGHANADVQIDPADASAWVHDILKETGAVIKKAADPCALPRAKKNAVEIAGTKAAHVRDGAALTRFLAWIAAEGPKGHIDEIAAVKKLEAFRRGTGELKDLSFDTIAGSGPNGAIVHYRVTDRTNRLIQPGELLLVDSGGQYLDGTTDVTRTIAIGAPTDEMRDRFTRVLKGHIGLAQVRFPKGTTGATIDVLARQALWRAGLDFDHGTGHGVGAYLSVHEGPQNISRRSTDIALEPGMIVSNEPGYYKTGAYGIRIENLVVVTPPAEIAGGERPMLGFETITLAPIDLALVEAGLMTAEERDWLNAYHARVRDTLTPLLDADTAAWLNDATRSV